MEQENNNWLRITGKVNIPSSLEIDTDYQLVGNISVYGVDRSSKQDGSYNVTSKASFCDEVALIKGETIIHAKPKKGSKSQKQRQAIYSMGLEYDPMMDFIMSIMPELEERFIKSDYYRE